MDQRMKDSGLKSVKNYAILYDARIIYKIPIIIYLFR